MLNAIAIHVQAIPTNSHYNKRGDLLQLFFVLPDVNFQHFNEYYPNDYIYIALNIMLTCFCTFINRLFIVKMIIS
jgi:hypothetical protein